MKSQASTKLPSEATFSISYSELIVDYVEDLKKLGKSRQTIKNARAAVRSWIQVQELDEQAPVGAELSDSFKENLSEYVAARHHAGVPKATYQPVVSRLKSVREFYLNRRELSRLPETFGERLAYLLQREGYKKPEFWNLFLSDYVLQGTFHFWFRGEAPQVKLFLAEIMEKALRVEPGTLSERLFFPRKALSQAPESNACNGRAKENIRKKFRVWTPKLAEQFAEFQKFKSEAVLPEGMNRLSEAVWTCTASATFVREEFKSFMGFCCLPREAEDPSLRGMGIPRERLSLALLSDKTLLETYLTVFRKYRSGGAYNQGTTHFIQTVLSILHETGGFLYQKPEFAAELPVPLEPSEWRNHCTATRNRLRQMLKYVLHAKTSGSEQYRPGRDSTERVKDILRLPQPLDATMQVLNQMFIDMSKLSRDKLTRAVLYRDALLIALIQSNPLRVGMFSKMEFDRHLVREADGSWWFEFERKDFKNRKRLLHDYRVAVSEELWGMIDEYREKYRPMLYGADKCQTVFLARRKKSRGRADNYPLSPGTLSGIIFRRTFQYLLDCPGFRAHAFRHVAATDIIKGAPETGLFLAAKVLHDKQETVESTYAHLQTSDYFKPYRRIFSERWRKNVDAP